LNHALGKGSIDPALGAPDVRVRAPDPRFDVGSMNRDVDRGTLLDGQLGEFTAISRTDWPE
jgi:hypothetical protein